MLEIEWLLMVFEEPATSIAAESLDSGECPKCDIERALTLDYLLSANAAKPTLQARDERLERVESRRLVVSAEPRKSAAVAVGKDGSAAGALNSAPESCISVLKWMLASGARLSEKSGVIQV
ncbi:hypothetical protein [Delftia sp. CH05]|uniref:hypothetical protein n=1 Tax=Delftia sp. CH05 TaxID=2692194 RepID=UPI00135DBC7F|nr:hypothetical protein [Delftia sp. CH05]MXN29483.1 hypothetical protein [Delftia sp. CH05]